MENPYTDVDKPSVLETIELLRRYMNEDEIAPVLAALQALSETPEDASLLEQLKSAMDDLGVLQGAALTYAPYLVLLLSDDPHIHPDDRDW